MHVRLKLTEELERSDVTPYSGINFSRDSSEPGIEM